MFCQVCHRIEDDDAVGWLPAQVKMMKGEFVVIEYIQATQMSVTDVVNIDLVRFPSKEYVCQVVVNHNYQYVEITVRKHR